MTDQAAFLRAITDAERDEVRQWIKVNRKEQGVRPPKPIVVSAEFHEILKAYLRETQENLGEDIAKYDGTVRFRGVTVVIESPASPFLRAICADPDNDTPRLIFADWLDENGEPELAEFIRVQCRIDEIYRTNDIQDDCLKPHAPYKCGMIVNWIQKPTCELCQLRARERELLNTGTLAWTRWLQMMIGVAEPGRLPEFRWQFRRGFVEEITCSWADWRQHADAIRAATPLKKVRLTTPPPLSAFAANFVVDQAMGIHRSMDYPGIEFELPQTSTRLWGSFGGQILDVAGLEAMT